MKPNTLNTLPARAISVWISGFLGLALRTLGEAAKIAGQIHAAIATRSPVISRSHEIATELTPFAYHRAQQWLALVAHYVHQLAPKHQPDEVWRVGWRRTQSIANGVLGDKLHHWRNPLAIDLHAVDQSGQRVCLKAVDETSAKGIVLFIHGLCSCPDDWHGFSPDHTEHQRFVAELRQQGLGVAWLRYNTGLPIWHNGMELAQLLEDTLGTSTRTTRITLIGHSMGGLLTRSACYHAEHHFSHRWVERVSHTACLGSPHGGAPLERAGNFANNLLGYSPYSRPLMALGNIRSLGIRNLHDAELGDPDSQHAQQARHYLYAKAHHLLIAGNLTHPQANWVFGDGVLPATSAFDISHDDDVQVTRVELKDCGHIRLLLDTRVYQALRTWLQPDSAPNDALRLPAPEHESADDRL